MRPIDFPERNLTFTAPPGQEDTVMDLPVRADPFPNPTQYVSKWELTDEEVQDVIDNKCIWLFVVNAGGHPPVSMATKIIMVSPAELKAEDELLSTEIIGGEENEMSDGNAEE